MEGSITYLDDVTVTLTFYPLDKKTLCRPCFLFITYTKHSPWFGGQSNSIKCTVGL